MHYDSGKSSSLTSLVPLFAKVANLLSIAVMENIGAIQPVLFYPTLDDFP